MKRKVPDEMTIERAVECRNFFLESLERKGEPCTDLSGVATIDLSGVQILVAYLKQAAAAAREVHFTGALSPEVQRAIAMAGLSEGDCATGEALESAVRAYL